MKSIHILALTAALLLPLASPTYSAPCTKNCNECCPSSSPCCPTPNCTKVCNECCKSDDSCCSSKKSKCTSSSSSVALERGGKKMSPYASKGVPRRY